MPPNQKPEQIARDQIDAQLRASGWPGQNKDTIDFNDGEGQSIREYQTDTGPADYVLSLGPGQPVGVIEVKKETLGQNITTVEDPTDEPASVLLDRIRAEREATTKKPKKKKTTRKRA